MKIRQGFVSNSSSSSFIIALENLTAKQLHKIKNHIEEGRKLELSFNGFDDSDEWEINVNNDSVTGSTYGQFSHG